jgi:hypothetical protein
MIQHLQPFEGAHRLSWSPRVRRDGPSPPMLMCNSGRAGVRGGEGGRHAQNPLARIVDVPVSIHTHVRDNNRCFSRRNFLPSLGFPSLPEAWKERMPMLHTVSCCRSCCRARFSHVPDPSSSAFQHLFDRAKSARTLPRWFTLSERRLLRNVRCDNP